MEEYRGLVSQPLESEDFEHADVCCLSPGIQDGTSQVWVYFGLLLLLRASQRKLKLSTKIGFLGLVIELPYKVLVCVPCPSVMLGEGKLQFIFVSASVFYTEELLTTPGGVLEISRHPLRVNTNFSMKSLSYNYKKFGICWTGPLPWAMTTSKTPAHTYCKMHFLLKTP